MQQVYIREGNRNKNYQIFLDNPPQWNTTKSQNKLTVSETNTYVYDFKGRVTLPSIKNFQLIPDLDGRKGETLSEFVLQFGKNGNDSFILDVQFPLSVFQGFGIALSAFDTE